MYCHWTLKILTDRLIHFLIQERVYKNLILVAEKNVFWMD